MLLIFDYKDAPDMRLYEFIYLSPDGQHRARNWQWLKNGELVKRTLIKETRFDAAQAIAHVGL